MTKRSGDEVALHRVVYRQVLSGKFVPGIFLCYFYVPISLPFCSSMKGKNHGGNHHSLLQELYISALGTVSLIYQASHLKVLTFEHLYRQDYLTDLNDSNSAG